MFDNISKEGLEKLGIYELRNVARQVGVYSPTLYKKDVLIDKVMAIVYGKEEPYVKKTNQGRPAKQIAGLDELLNIFIPEVNPATSFSYNLKKENIFSVSMMQNIEGRPDNVEMFSGYVKILPENYAVVFKDGYFNSNKDTYYITPQKFAMLSLKEGDYIKGEYYHLGDDKPNIVQNIKTLNGEVYDENREPNRVSFESLEAIYPTKQIKIGGEKDSQVDFKLIDKITPIGEGSRVIVNYEKDFEVDGLIIDFVNVLSRDNVNDVTLFAVSERPEDISYIKNECTELDVINANTYKENEEFIETCNMMFKNLVRRVEKGKNQILIIKNTQKLINALTKYYSLKLNCSENEASIHAKDKLINLFALAKNTESGKALTIIAFNSLNESMNDLANVNIYFNKDTFKGSSVWYNPLKSSSVRANMLLTKQEFEKLKEFKTTINEDNLFEKMNDILD